MKIPNTLNVRQILMATLVVATTMFAYDCQAQSFMEKAKAKAKAKLDAKAKAKAKASAPTTKGGATNIKAPTSTKNQKGIYHLLEAERSPAGGTTKTLIIEQEKHPYTGADILGVQACPNGCTPGIYNYQEEPSTTLGIRVYFVSAGIYIMEYDENSYVSVMPDTKLGQIPFTKFAFSNFYSTDASKVKGMTKAKVEAYAIKMSKKILAPSTSGPSKGGSGVYYPAVEIHNARKPYSKLNLTYVPGDKKTIKLKFGDNGSTDTYEFMAEFSKIVGVDVYKNSLYHYQKYIYVYKPGVLLYTRYMVQDLGYQYWNDHENKFNFFAMDKQLARSLVNDEALLKDVENKLVSWTKQIRDHTIQKDDGEANDVIDKQRLPKEGLVESALKTQTLQAAINWATKWKWKETVTRAYFSGADWYIVRHKHTGVILRRSINGVIVMKRPDGMCSFHKAVFGQQYDGSKYNKVYTVGITPGQLKLNCEHTK